MVTSGTAGDFRCGSTNSLRNGNKKLRPRGSATDGISGDCVHSAGGCFEFGNTRSRGTQQSALTEFSGFGHSVLGLLANGYLLLSPNVARTLLARIVKFC